MIVRIKFSKTGAMKFLGHLDVLRYFQKAIRRSGIDIAYSQGFHPHQIMSFAQPLGVGVTSEGEYVDIEMNSFSSEDEIMTRLNAAMTDGFKVLKVTHVADPLPNTKKETAMSLVAAADYRLTLREGYELPCTMEEFSKRFDAFMSQEQINIIKTTKTGEHEIDCKPLIFDYLVDESGIFLKLSAGSTDNIKPELIIEAFYDVNDFKYNKFAYQVHRLELYAKKGELRPLWTIK